jgi:hypothetical protein
MVREIVIVRDASGSLSGPAKRNFRKKYDMMR